MFALSFLFMAVNLIWTAYFYSTKQTGKANVIAISRGIVVKALAIFAVPALFGSAFVWHAAVLAEAITLLIGLICRRLPASGAAREVL